MLKNILLKVKNKFNIKSKPDLSTFYWNRIRREMPFITKNTTVDKYNHTSFEYIDNITSNTDVWTRVKALEMFTEDGRFRLVYTKNSNKPNFYDLITPTLKEEYPSTAKKIEDIITKKIMLPVDIEVFGNIFSQSSTINNMMSARKAVYDSVKQQSKNEIIDVSNMSYASYMTVEGMLAYQKTINSQDYTINNSSDQIFRNLLQKGIFLKKESPNIEIIYSGTSFLEMEWAKAIHAQYNPRNKFESRPIELIDCSGIPLKYMFSEDRPKHKSKIFDSTQLIRELGIELKDNETIFIKNNAIHSESIESVISEMNELKKIDTSKGIFYTTPILGCTTTEKHYASNHSFGKHFIENILLSQVELFTPYATPQFRKEGMYYEVGFIANENSILYNQTLTDEIKIKKGTKIIYYKSWRYNEDTINKFSKISKSKISEPVNGVVGIYR